MKSSPVVPVPWQREKAARLRNDISSPVPSCNKSVNQLKYQGKDEVRTLLDRRGGVNIAYIFGREIRLMKK
ncbi:MAG TPA: hypothetical protein ENH05_04810 [Rhizobiales bacterium]|nr:hypothetical protein [Hyphomicrobiales bacterium]